MPDDRSSSPHLGQHIGVAAGTASGVVVVDVDPAHRGTDSLAHLQSLMGSLPGTLTARTGSGLHLLYAHPSGEVRNTAGRLPGIAEPLPGVDPRGDGGYIVAAPSRHRSGACYSWIDPDTTVAAAPTWLWPPARRSFPTDSPRRKHQWEAGSRYGHSALRAEVADVRHAPVGDRNNRLNRAAFCLGMLVAGDELDETLVESELLVAALAVGLTEPEAIGSIRSGLNAGLREPRRRPGA